MNYQNEGCVNVVEVAGTVDVKPVLTHTVKGEGIYEFKLRVKRKSETYDIIPISISERTLLNDELNVGDFISIKGDFRSYSKFISENKTNLLLNVFVSQYQKLEAKNEKELNEFYKDDIKLSGYLCKEPIYRVTPLGREITDVLIAVNRRSNSRSDYIPLIFWGRNANFIKTLGIGSKIYLEGRIQSRNYNKVNSDNSVCEKTAYEVSSHNVEILSQKNNSQEVLAKCQ